MTAAFFILFFGMFPILPGNGAPSKKSQLSKISIKPQRAVSLGDNATITCEGPLFSSLHFYYLVKDGQEISCKRGMGNMDFPITNANPNHGGIYTCYYADLKNQSKSCRSKPVELLIRDPALPRPSMYFYPSRMAVLKSYVYILCEVKGPSKQIYLHAGGVEKNMDPAADYGCFFIPAVGWDDGKSYQCSYSSQSGFFISEPSHPMELLIVDLRFPRPNISLSHMDGVPVGSNVTIDCQSQDMPKDFYLRKLNPDQNASIFESLQTLQAEGTTGKFLIANASLDHRGSYNCSYHPKSEPFSVSESSDGVELLITDSDLLRPAISMRPPGIARLRTNVTIYCSTNGSFERFVLYKSGDPMTSQPMETDGDMAVFSINNVTVDDSGIYHCCYRPTLKSFLISKPSNQVELLVLDPSLPRPEISIIPSGMSPLGGQVIIECDTEVAPAIFSLHKDGDPTWKWLMNVSWDVGEYSFSSIKKEHQGNYTCNYAMKTRPSAISAHSKPVELLVSDINSPLLFVQCSEIVAGNHPSLQETSSSYSLRGNLGGPTEDTRLNRAEYQSVVEESDLQDHDVAPMMPSVSIILLWLLGSSEESEYDSNEVQYTVISASLPTAPVLLGERVTISCRTYQEDCIEMTLRLNRKTTDFQLRWNGRDHEFYKRDVTRQYGGEYTCCCRIYVYLHSFYHSWGQLKCSKPVELLIADPSLPQPRITLTPQVVSLGEKVTIECLSEERTYWFYLQRPRRPRPVKHRAANRSSVQVSITEVSQKDFGSYTCMYAASSPFVVSQPSNSVTLQLTDTSMINYIGLVFGVAVLVLILGLGAFLWSQKRKPEKRQSTAPVSGEHSFRVMKTPWKANSGGTSANESEQQSNLPPEQDSTTETQNVIYAEVKFAAVKTEEESADDSDGCIYTTVVLH
ncbi:alpha-1B-glycoprotein-like [Paroedura picta]|uniref:alpha-1B-glycoprotein-like n=1 Tax=Paroedura picta TaxID=143630 RepID=UPI0040576031